MIKPFTLLSSSIICILIILLPACSEKQATGTAEEETALLPPYRIDLAARVTGPTTTANLSEVAQEIGYVALETTSGCLLKRIDQSMFYNNTLLVSDFSNLYQFNSEECHDGLSFSLNKNFDDNILSFRRFELSAL